MCCEWASFSCRPVSERCRTTCLLVDKGWWGRKTCQDLSLFQLFVEIVCSWTLACDEWFCVCQCGYADRCQEAPRKCMGGQNRKIFSIILTDLPILCIRKITHIEFTYSAWLGFSYNISLTQPYDTTHKTNFDLIMFKSFLPKDLTWQTNEKFQFVSTPPQENIHFFQPGVFALVWLIYPGKVKKERERKRKDFTLNILRD